MKIAHYVITRLNLGRFTAGGGEKWTRERMDLYSRYAYPSLLAQTNRSFEIVVVIDGNTPEHLHEEMAELWPEAQFVSDFREGRAKESNCGKGSWHQGFLNMVPIKARRLLTTRLDSDDWFLPSFVQAIHDHIPKDMPSIVDFKSQIAFDPVSRMCGLVHYKKVPTEVCTLVESPANARGVYWAPHTKMQRHSKVLIVAPGVHWAKYRTFEKGKYRRTAMEDLAEREWNMAWDDYNGAMADDQLLKAWNA